LAVSAPGGGKSATFDHIITPIAKLFQDDTGFNLLLENYTHAGMQNHQGDCKGYGMIASDEGIRFLSNVQAKQLKNEGERQFLCKSWTGKGDFTVLKDHERGFLSTSMSMILFVQPEPLLGHFCNFDGEDGLMDRLLIPVAMPLWHKSEVVATNSMILNDVYAHLVEKTFEGIYLKHKEKGMMYRFTDDAQTYFDNLSDDYADEFNKQYQSGISLVIK
jgi:hypothetical protein